MVPICRRHPTDTIITKERTMKLRFAAALICTSLFGIAASAHNGIEHVMGTVKDISATSVTIQTEGNAPQEVTIALLPTTKFHKDGAESTMKALNVGDR